MKKLKKHFAGMTNTAEKYSLRAGCYCIVPNCSCACNGYDPNNPDYENHYRGLVRSGGYTSNVKG